MPFTRTPSRASSPASVWIRWSTAALVIPYTDWPTQHKVSDDELTLTTNCDRDSRNAGNAARIRNNNTRTLVRDVLAETAHVPLGQRICRPSSPSSSATVGAIYISGTVGIAGVCAAVVSVPGPGPGPVSICSLLARSFTCSVCAARRSRASRNGGHGRPA